MLVPSSATWEGGKTCFAAPWQNDDMTLCVTARLLTPRRPATHSEQGVATPCSGKTQDELSFQHTAFCDSVRRAFIPPQGGATRRTHCILLFNQLDAFYGTSANVFHKRCTVQLNFLNFIFQQISLVNSIYRQKFR